MVGLGEILMAVYYCKIQNFIPKTAIRIWLRPIIAEVWRRFEKSRGCFFLTVIAIELFFCFDMQMFKAAKKLVSATTYNFFNWKMAVNCLWNICLPSSDWGKAFEAYSIVGALGLVRQFLSCLDLSGDYSGNSFLNPKCVYPREISGQTPKWNTTTSQNIWWKQTRPVKGRPHHNSNFCN